LVAHKSGVSPLTIGLGIKITYAKGLRAIGNVDALSIVVVVTVPPHNIQLTRPCYIHLPGVLGAVRIWVVVDLLSWADSQQDGQICKAEKLHTGDAFEELVTNVRKQ
jgi:hypothetical protein